MAEVVIGVPVIGEEATGVVETIGIVPIGTAQATETTTGEPATAIGATTTTSTISISITTIGRTTSTIAQHGIDRVGTIGEPNGATATGRTHGITTASTRIIMVGTMDVGTDTGAALGTPRWFGVLWAGAWVLGPTRFGTALRS